jgi:Flp pilus assembly protein TadD
MDFGDRFSLPMRLCNAVVSLARYPVKMFAPVGLSAFYPHPGWWPWWEVAGATAIVGAVTWLAWRERARRGWLLFGWGWYVVTLLPVIGIAQVGAHSIADRYTYVPLLGIFTILAWAGAEVVQRSPGWRAPLAAAAGLALAACLVRTMWQVPVWRDGITLVENMRSAVGRHPVVHRAMAQALATAGRPERDIIAEYRSGLELDPRNPHFLTQLGNAAAGAGKFDEALSLLGQARDIVPADATAWYNLGVVSARAGRLEDAIRFGRKAIERRPRMGPAHWLLAQVFEGQGRRLDTCAALREAIDCNRWDWVAWNDLGIAYAGLKRPADSLACFERAHWIHPGEKDIARNLAEARKRAGGSGR